MIGTLRGGQGEALGDYTSLNRLHQTEGIQGYRNCRVLEKGPPLKGSPEFFNWVPLKVLTTYPLNPKPYGLGFRV